MGYHHYWSAEAPFVRDLDEARRITVPTKGFYLEQGCGQRQRQVIEELGGEVAVFGDCSSPTMAFLVCLRGMNRALFDLIEEPELVHAIMEKGAAIAVEKGKFNIDLGLKILRLNDSVGNMSVISPEHWREFVFPHMREVCDTLHAYDPQARIYCHICGNILPIAEDLVETGLDCIGPLDPLGNFAPAQIRERVGDAVSLMGGVNTLTFLDGTPEQIVEESVACMQQAGGQGGYILCSGCVVPRGAPKENLLALRKAADAYGIYRQGRLVEK
jgi:uroporphyrinogen-III decarboxylase